MGQAEIMALLKKEKGWLSSRQVAEKLGVSNALRALQVLATSGEVKRRYVKVNSHHEFQWKTGG